MVIAHFAFQRSDPLRHTYQGGEMTTGGGTRDGEALWTKTNIDRPRGFYAMPHQPHHPDDPAADIWGVRRRHISYGTGEYAEFDHHPLAACESSAEVDRFGWPDPTAYDFVAMAERVGREPGLAGLELNLSCPNVSGGLDFATDPEVTRRIVRGVRDVCPLPVLAKLTPNVTDVVPVAQAAASQMRQSSSAV